MHSLSPHVTTTTCDKVVQAGYQLGDRVVRPALVTVVDPDPDAVGKTDDQADDQADGRTDGRTDGQAAPEVATADEQG